MDEKFINELLDEILPAVGVPNMGLGRNIAKGILEARLSNLHERVVRQGVSQPMLLAEELEDMELEAKAELIVDNDLRYGDNDKAVYWKLQANTSDEIEAEECLELLAKNWKVGTKIFVFVPEDSKQSA